MYSAAKPDFIASHRSEQARDIVRGLDTDRVKKIDFKASGPKLGPLFDGAQLIGVTSEPWYTRQTYLPEFLKLSVGWQVPLHWARNSAQARQAVSKDCLAFPSLE